MNPAMTPPEFPVGPFEPVATFSETVRDELIDVIASAPARLRQAVAGLDDAQLDSLYKNWTIRQITHHLADSHSHSILRFKWTLAEDRPTIKPYDESVWARLDDARRGAIEPSLALLDAIHQKWVQILRMMTPEQYAREFFHPETGQYVSLWQALNNYAWHSRHHTGQILWKRKEMQLESD